LQNYQKYLKRKLELLDQQSHISHYQQLKPLDHATEMNPMKDEPLPKEYEILEFPNKFNIGQKRVD